MTMELSENERETVKKAYHEYISNHPNAKLQAHFAFANSFNHLLALCRQKRDKELIKKVKEAIQLLQKCIASLVNDKAVNYSLEISLSIKSGS